MIRFLSLLIAATLLLSKPTQAQVAINNSATPANASAMLDVSSTSKGVLVPRMNKQQRDLIESPAPALLIYQTDNTPGFYYNSGTSLAPAWTAIAGGSGVFENYNGTVRNTGNMATDHFIFGASQLPPNGTSSLGNMFFLDKSKGAFRAGNPNGTYWATDSLGINSFAAGSATKAIGDYSAAFGENTTARGLHSIAGGYYSVASGENSLAMGYQNYTGANHSAAIGMYDSATGYSSFCAGWSNVASGYASATFGKQHYATGSNSMATGTGNLSQGTNSFTMGQGTKARGYNAFAGGYNSEANNELAFAFGQNAFANGINSLATGFSSRANANRSIAMGVSVYANTYTSIALGRYNDTVLGSSPDNIVSTDPVFMVGSGTAENARRNSITVLKNGNVGIQENSPAAVLQVSANSSIGNGQVLLSEKGDNADGARLTFKNTARASFWDLYGLTNATNASAAFNFFYSAVGNILNLKGDGNATLLGTLTQNSDERLKKNIQPLEDPAEKLYQLNGYTYNWKDDARDHSTQVGLLAQEVEQQFPELVKEDEKGIKSVNYIGLIPVLLEALKTQQKEIDALKKKPK